MTLHNFEGDVLATLVFSGNMLDTHLMYESLEQLSGVAELADDYREMLAVAKLPITAGHFVTYIVLSLFLITAGFLMVIAVRRRATV
jgi:hypothetical protein